MGSKKKTASKLEMESVEQGISVAKPEPPAYGEWKRNHHQQRPPGGTKVFQNKTCDPNRYLPRYQKGGYLPVNFEKVFLPKE